jgi:peptidoglycan/xylan/chitin deacetylase (PgdA/CDA1 family)
VRGIVFRLLRWSGVPALLRATAQRGRVTILVYHDPRPEVFDGHLRVLGRAYHIISLQRYLISRGGDGATLPPKALVVTFDDGYASNFELREPLRRHGIRPTVFVCTGIAGTLRRFWFRNVDDVESLKRVPDAERLSRLAAAGFDAAGERPPREALSDAEIQELASIAEIQAHTVTHPILPRCTDDRARDEIVDGKRDLEQRFGFEVYALAYPNGEYTEREVELARSAGYRCALAVGGRTNPRGADLFRLQRIAIDDHDGVDELLVKASGLWPWLQRASGRQAGSSRLVPAFVLAAVVAGWTFRLSQYLANRSLWLDESQLALNIIDRSLWTVTDTLDLDQAAPAAFLVLEKLAADGFGASEYALRLVPLLCGLASVPLFIALSRRALQPPAQVLAMLLFACAAGPIYYSSEVKQYAGDLLATLVLFLLAHVLLHTRVTRRTAIAAAAGGALVILLSHASVFVAAGISLVLGARFAARRGTAETRAFLTTLPWLASGLLVILLTLSRTSHVRQLIGSDSSAYVQTSSSHAWLDWLRSLVSALIRSIGYPDSGVGSYLHWPVAILALFGLVSLLINRRTQAAILVSPVVPLVIASALHKYPLFDRTVLFLVPATILFAAEGVRAVTSWIPSATASRIAGTAAAIFVLVLPATYAVKHVVEPREHEEIKAALAQIRDRWHSGDTFFVERNAQFALRYYLDCGCFSPAEPSGGGSAWRFAPTPRSAERAGVVLVSRPPYFIVGRTPAGEAGSLLRELDALRGRRRVWILYTHTTNPTEALVLSRTVPRHLDRIGRKLEEFDDAGARVYLYDLR